MKKDKMARIFNFLQTFAGAFYKVKKIAQLLNFSQKQKKNTKLLQCLWQHIIKMHLKLKKMWASINNQLSLKYKNMFPFSTMILMTKHLLLL
jgi:glutaredoxin 2